MTEAIKEALRTCADCGKKAWTEEDLEGFMKNRRSQHGRANCCKPCASARTRGWNAENANRVRERDRQYREANRERISDYMRAYRETNRDRILEYDRKYAREYRSGAFRDRLIWDVREMSYQSIHNRLNAHFGKASEYTCVHCDGPAREWAYTNDSPDPRYGDNGKGSTVAYSLLPEYYMPLCSGCHRAFDANHRNGQKA